VRGDTGGISGEMIRHLMLEATEEHFGRRTSHSRSNGMAEALMKTFKRDYIHVDDRPDPQSVLSQLPRWLGEHNETHPRALQLKLPCDLTAACPAWEGKSSNYFKIFRLFHPGHSVVRDRLIDHYLINDRF
jgi:hypothetical protein